MTSPSRRSSSSPAECPWVSLTDLKRSQSTSIRWKGGRSRASAASSARRRSKWRRLNRPVRASRTASSSMCRARLSVASSRAIRCRSRLATRWAIHSRLRFRRSRSCSSSCSLGSDRGRGWRPSRRARQKALIARMSRMSTKRQISPATGMHSTSAPARYRATARTTSSNTDRGSARGSPGSTARPCDSRWCSSTPAGATTTRNSAMASRVRGLRVSTPRQKVSMKRRSQRGVARCRPAMLAAEVRPVVRAALAASVLHEGVWFMRAPGSAGRAERRDRLPTCLPMWRSVGR